MESWYDIVSQKVRVFNYHMLPDLCQHNYQQQLSHGGLIVADARTARMRIRNDHTLFRPYLVG